MTSRRRRRCRRTPDVTFSDIIYSNSLAVESFVVEKGIAERSFIQYLDVDFNQTVSTSSALQEPGDRAQQRRSHH